MTVPVEELESAGVAAKGQGMKEVVAALIPGLETKMACNMEGNSSFPQIAFHVIGPDGMGLFCGDQGRGGRVFCHYKL